MADHEAVADDDGADAPDGERADREPTDGSSPARSTVPLDGAAGESRSGEPDEALDDKRDKRSTSKPKGAKSAQVISDVVNIFLHEVSAELIGKSTSGTAPSGKGMSRDSTGDIADDEVLAETRCYCRPDNFDEAAKDLAVDHVVILCGPSGRGKRTGGINLLREVTTGQLIVASMVTDLKDLGTRSYRRGCGYLIVNRIDTGESTADVDFAWRTIKNRVRSAGAYLVVTTLTATDSRVESVSSFTWNMPDVTAVLRCYLADRDDVDDVVRTIAEQVEEDCSMTDLATVASLVADGTSPAKALESLAENSARRVTEWFDGKRSITEILDATAMVFLEGSTHREFESLRVSLDAAMEHHEVIGPPAADKKAKQKQIPVSRGDRLRSGGLITLRTVGGYTTDRRVLQFRHPSYRRFVAAELCERYEAAFWNAIADWLAAIVVRRSDVQIARGLASMAGADFDEVERSYITPWSKGVIGPYGQATAVFILWWMSCAEDTQPVALKIAKTWANHGDPEQRWCAAMAYSGELGARDPAQAIKQLWQLVVQAGKGYEQACFAMSALFATLLDLTDKAGKVLTTVEQQLRRPLQKRGDRIVVARARDVLVQLLLVRANSRNVPAVFVYMHRHPERLDAVARLWAEAICNRVYRKVVLEALWLGLSQLVHVTDTPEAALTLARELGRSLASALPDGELDAFYDDLKTIASWKRDGFKATESPARALLDVVGRFYHRRTS